MKPGSRHLGPEKDDSSSSNSSEPFSIYRYFNYRKYLEEHYRYRKSRNRHFSYRYFAKRAGINSSAIYLLLVQGKQNMTPNLVKKFAKGLDLGERETAYLINMVGFTHAKTPGAKQDFFDHMVELIPRGARQLTKNEKNYYEKWYHVPVREALSILNVNENFQELAEFLQPSIKVREARSAVGLLSELSLIQKDGDGYWRSTNSTLQSTPELGAYLIRNFQKNMMNLAGQALDTCPPSQRNISSLTASLSRKGRDRLIRKFDQFLEETEKLVASDSDESRVYQINLQLFPLSREKEKGNEIQ